MPNAVVFPFESKFPFCVGLGVGEECGVGVPDCPGFPDAVGEGVTVGVAPVVSPGLEVGAGIRLAGLLSNSTWVTATVLVALSKPNVARIVTASSGIPSITTVLVYAEV